MTDLAHATWSPSAAHRRIPCEGSLALESVLPEKSSSFADEGTAAHELASMALTDQRDAAAYMGRIIRVDAREVGRRKREFEVDADMAEEVQKYLDKIRQCAAGHDLMVEQRLEFSDYIGVPGQFGTSDAVILTPDEIQVHDLKYGKGVRVDAEENEQLMLYALGALATFGMLGDFKRVRCVIHQVRLDHLSEWDCSVDELLAFAERAKSAAQAGFKYLAMFQRGEQIPLSAFNPGDKQCRFCKAKATCPALAGEVSRIAYGDPSSLGNPHDAAKPQAVPRSASLLGTYRDRVGLVMDWAKAVIAQTDAELDAGNEVPGWKRVTGKKGDRRWESEDSAAKQMKGMRLKHEEMYSYKIISPTQAEKKFAKEYPRAWPKLKELITQPPGGPTTVPADDPRPAITAGSIADDFTDLT